MNESPEEVKKRRVQELNYFLNLIDDLIEFNKKVHQSNRKSNWKHQVSESNIRKLKSLKAEVLEYLEEKNLDRFAQFYLSSESPYFFEFISKSGSAYKHEILKFSPNSTIYSDVQWLPDAPYTVGESMEIALGHRDLKFLDSYLSKKLKDVRDTVIPDIKKLNVDQTFADLVKEAIRSSQSNKIVLSNLILFPVIEGIVTSSLWVIYVSQNSNVDLESLEQRFNDCTSLADKITKLNWSEDLPENIFHVYSHYSYVQNKTMDRIGELIKNHVSGRRRLSEVATRTAELDFDNEDREKLMNKLKADQDEVKTIFEDQITDEKRIVKIGVDTEFYFLARRIREDRNKLLHGNLEGFHYKYQNYIYFSALQKSVTSILRYKEVYPEI